MTDTSDHLHDRPFQVSPMLAAALAGAPKNLATAVHALLAAQAGTLQGQVADTQWEPVIVRLDVESPTLEL